MWTSIFPFGSNEKSPCISYTSAYWMQDFTVLAEHFQYDDVTAAHFALRWLPYMPSIILHFFGFVQAIDMDIYSHRYGYLWCPYYCCNSVVAFRLLFQEGELRFHSCISSSVSHTLCLPLHLALIFGISPLCFYQNTHSALSSFLLMAVLWQLCKIPCDWS